MLAMKCVSARFDSHDRDDVEFLIRHLGLESPAAVFEVICRYYPRERVPAKTAFFVEEILHRGDSRRFSLGFYIQTSFILVAGLDADEDPFR